MRVFWLTVFFVHLFSSGSSVDTPRNRKRDISVADMLESARGTVYFDLRTVNYSNLLELPHLKSLYLIANNNILLRLSNDNLRLLSSFELPSKPSPSMCLGNPEAVCIEKSALNLLSLTKDGQNLWYCYVYQTNYLHNTILPNVDSARCEIPDPLTLNPEERLVQWENSVFSSLDLAKPGVHIVSKDGFLYTAGWFHTGSRIHRTSLPNFDGLPNWEGFLSTPENIDYFQEPVTFVATFETEDQVFFLFRESEKSNCPAKLLSQDANAVHVSQSATVTRLARVCKADPGGFVHVNAGEFTTFAKATVECTLGNSQVDQFGYVYAVAATWDTVDEMLYILFNSKDAHLHSSVVCVYSKNAITETFEGDAFSMINKEKQDTVKSTFKNMCSRLNSGVITDSERDHIRSLSKRHLQMHKPIQPFNRNALLVQHDPGRPVWHAIRVDHVGDRRVLYLTSTDSIERYRLYRSTTPTSLSACYLDRFYLGAGAFVGDAILEAITSERSSSHEFYILTSKHLIRLPASEFGCHRFITQNECDNRLNPYCQWNAKLFTCEQSVRSKQNGPFELANSGSQFHDCAKAPSDIQEPIINDWWKHLFDSTQSPKMNNDVVQSPPVFKCEHRSGNTTASNLTCWCRPCIDCSERSYGIFELVNCTIQQHWTPWSGWSSCPVLCGFGVRSRTRYTENNPITIPRIPPLENNAEHRGGIEAARDKSAELSSETIQVELESCSMYPLCKEASPLPSVGKSSGIEYFWDEWTSCSNTCGVGTRKRRRRCHLLQDSEDNEVHSTECMVVGAGASENQICYSRSCTGTHISSQWTQWLQYSTSRSESFRRFRFVCNATDPFTKELRIAKEISVDRKCDLLEKNCQYLIGESNQKSDPFSNAIYGRFLWSSWTECPQKCVSSSSVLEMANEYNRNTAPSYKHDQYQYSFAQCSSGQGTSCVVGSLTMKKSRECTPMPACSSGWSCWSSWSACNVAYKNTEKKLSCKWSYTGIRTRDRICILGQKDWLEGKPLSCQGDAEQTERCLIGIGSECIQKLNATWSDWSAWSTCPAVSASYAIQHHQANGETLHTQLTRSRFRKCIALYPGDGANALAYEICHGAWRQRKTCHESTLKHAPYIESRLFSNTECTFGQLIAVSCGAFVIAALITLIGVILHYYCRRKQYSKLEQRTAVDTISGGIGNAYHNINSAELSADNAPLILSGPPQPILSLPSHVTSDILESNTAMDNPYLPTNGPAVYDSVASQDLPTFFNFHSGQYLTRSTQEPSGVETDPTGDFQERDTDWDSSPDNSRGHRFYNDSLQDFYEKNILNFPQTKSIQPDFDHDYDNQSDKDPRSSEIIANKNAQYHRYEEIAKLSDVSDLERIPSPTSVNQYRRRFPNLEYLSDSSRESLSQSPISMKWVKDRDTISSDDVYSVCLDRPPNPHLRDPPDHSSSTSDVQANNNRSVSRT